LAAIGRSRTRLDAVGKVTGEARFPGDFNMPAQAYMKILFAGRPHAVITRLDTHRAEALPGVLAVFTASDVPHNEYGLILPDQPVLCGPDSKRAGAERVRFVGDQVALVVAESEKIAAQGLRLIEVYYRDQPVVTDPREAMREGSPLLFPERGSNVFCQYRIRKGDVDRGFAQADAIVEADYYTPMQEHAYLQPEAGLGYIDEDYRERWIDQVADVACIKRDYGIGNISPCQYK